MPMLDIQRRHADVFRIRLGHQVAGRNGKTRPEKLTDAMRITSRGRHIVQAFADVYGGEPTEWEGQWEVYLPTSELRILVLPGQSVTQWWEKYKGSVCERRCDGYQEQKSGKRCVCPEDTEERAGDRDACSPTTRVNVLCPDVAVVGAGCLVTHSMIAAETLPQSIAVAETALSRGMMVPAVLRVVEHRGRNHFIVPQIEIAGVSMNELAAGSANLQMANDPAPLNPGEEQSGNAPLTPVPPSVPERPVASVAEQAAAVNADPEPSKRRNAQAPMPPTGMKPRTAEQAVESATPEQVKALESLHGALPEERRPGCMEWLESKFEAKTFAALTEPQAAQAIADLTAAVDDG